MAKGLAVVTGASSGIGFELGRVKTKLEGAMANLTPGVLKGKMHDDMAKPLSDK